MKVWTEERDLQLRALYANTPNREIGKILGSSVKAINSRARVIGLKKDPSYNRMANSIRSIPHDKKLFIKNNYDRYTNHVLAKLVGVGESTIQKVRRRFGLNKENEGCFKKGATPPNKGKKQTEYMSAESIARTKHTRFKKGQLSHNTKDHDGEITVRTNKRTKRQYKYIRLSVGKWKELHLVIWEQHNGKPPKGSNVQFSDGNSLNVVIENLYLIKREDQMKKNTIHRYPTEVKKTIRTLSKFNRKLKQYEEQD